MTSPATSVFLPGLFDGQVALITCGGDFDWNTHHYADNVVLFAQPD